MEPELIDRCVAGDRAAFAELYARYEKRVTSLVGRMLRNSSECEEVTQEVFLQVFLSLPRFEGRSSFFTWIFRVARNVALHHIRASAHRHQVAAMSLAMEGRLVRPSWLTGTSPELDADYNALLVETTRVIDQLLPNLREVMMLGPIDGNTCEEMAGLLRMKTEAVKSRLHRARTSVRDAMWRVDRRGLPLVAILPVLPPLIESEKLWRARSH